MKLFVGAVPFATDRGKDLQEYALKYFDELVLNPTERQLTEDELIPLLKGCDAAVAGLEPYTEKVISSCPDLKVVSRNGVGYDSVDIEACRKAGVAVCNTPGANSTAVAELALALMLCCLRRIPQGHIEVVSGHFDGSSAGNTLSGKTVGIVGMGSIGKATIKVLKGFDCRILAYSPHFDNEFALENNVTQASFEEVLSQSDVVSLSCASKPETRHIINKNTLALMKKSAILVNTARGALVDENALYEALKNRTIAAAATDVYQTEPCFESPLFELDNMVFAPHIAGVTKESVWSMGSMAVENAQAVLNGTKPISRIV